MTKLYGFICKFNKACWFLSSVFKADINCRTHLTINLCAFHIKAISATLQFLTTSITELPIFKRPSQVLKNLRIAKNQKIKNKQRLIWSKNTQNTSNKQKFNSKYAQCSTLWATERLYIPTAILFVPVYVNIKIFLGNTCTNLFQSINKILITDWPHLTEITTTTTTMTAVVNILQEY